MNSPSRPTRVLVVDDNEKLLRVLAQVLARCGLDVATASSGSGALELAAAGHFDIAIVDLLLPDMGGLGLLSRLREHGLTGPVVVMSGYASCLEADRFKELGVTHVLPKPARLSAVLQAVGQAAGLSGANLAADGAAAVRSSLDGLLQSA